MSRRKEFRAGMKKSAISGKMLLIAALIPLFLSSCGAFFVARPELDLQYTRLSPFDRYPIWEWTVRDSTYVSGFKVKLDDGDYFDVPLDGSSNPEFTPLTYQPSTPLSVGVHQLKVKTKTVVGFKSLAARSALSVVSLPLNIFDSAIGYTSFTPDDQYFPKVANGANQWALENVKAPDIWGILKAIDADPEFTRGDVVVAVIDTGYTNHPDVIGNIDPSLGYDFVSNTSQPSDGDGRDADATDPGDDDPIVPGIENTWHGTAVSSVIAAETDNAYSLAGLGLDGGNITIMPIRALGWQGGTSYDLADAIRYAAGLPNESGVFPSTPAKVINLSLGYNFAAVDPYMESAIIDAYESGAIIVAASSNYGVSEIYYPASSPYTIAVGSIAEDDTLSPFSNYGDMQDIVAPGGNFINSQIAWHEVGGTSGPVGDYYGGVWVNIPRFDATQPLQPSDYGVSGVRGTSFSTPHVAGVLALLCTVNDSMAFGAVLQIIQNGSRDLGAPGRDNTFGWGALDAPALFVAYSGATVKASAADMSARGIGSQPQSMTGKGLDPHAELADDPLIVRFTYQGASRDSGVALLSGVRSVRASAGTDHALEVDRGAEIQTLRDAILDEPYVEEVFFNYRYQPF